MLSSALKKKLYIYVFLILLFLGFIGYFFIRPSQTLAISQPTLDKIIKENVQPISIKPCFGGTPFCDYKIISFEKNNNKIKLYLWILAQEYYIKNNSLLKGSGGEFSAIVTIKKEGNKFKFLNCNISREIETYRSLNIFPKSIRNKALRMSSMNESTEKIQKNAQTYFRKKELLK